MPWLAVLRKPSQTQCLTLPIPSHQTDRNLCRLQFKTSTTEQFCCDFWKLSLQHSPLSPAAPKAQPEPHSHITNTSSLCPPCPAPQCSLLALVGSSGNSTGKGRALLSSAELRALGQPLTSPETTAFLWSRGRRNVPVLEHKPGIIIFPVPAPTQPQLSFLRTFARRLSWRMEKEEVGQLLISSEH